MITALNSTKYKHILRDSYITVVFIFEQRTNGVPQLHNYSIVTKDHICIYTAKHTIFFDAYIIWLRVLTQTINDE